MSSETPKVQQTAEEEEVLPPLTPFQHTKYNALAKKMQYFHSYLQGEFEQAYELADGSYTKRGMSFKSYLNSVDQFRMHLTMHHDIEEAHVFPKLAERMPEFRENERHKTSHKLIHDGLDRVEAAVKAFKKDPTKYKPETMREALDSFREPLYTHLAEEVRDLSAENMRKYWSIEDLKLIPM